MKALMTEELGSLAEAKAKAKAPVSTHLPAARLQGSNKGRIVIAEDNADYRAYLTRVLGG